MKMYLKQLTRLFTATVFCAGVISLITGPAALADQTILDDLIIDGSICTGMDCVNGESFGFDTLRLKENNLRIRFVDTSNSSSFPSNDWQITVNDSANGGANKFSIDDIDGGRTPFTIEAGAPSHSLYVDDGGRIGAGTSTPVVDIHVKSGNTPTLRLEQDGSSGFTPQTWDVAGNEANFFIRDATNGSTLPFRIVPGAPTNSMYINSTGSVVIGGTTPNSYFGVTAKIDVTSGSGDHPFIGINTSSATETAALTFAAGGVDKWMLASRHENAENSATFDRFAFFSAGAAEVFTIHQNGNVFIGNSEAGSSNGGTNNNTNFPLEAASGAHLTTGGVWTDASSRSFKEDIAELTTAVAVNALEALNPVTYSYKLEPEETYAGFIAEDVPEIVATNDRKSLAPMDIVAVLTKVLQEQQQALKAQQQSMNKLTERLDKLEKK